MKKIFGILMCIFLVCGMCLCFASAVQADGTVTFSSVTANTGGKAEILISIDCPGGVKTVSLLDFLYDHTALTVVENECKWLVNGKLQDIDFDNNASIITFAENTVLRGNVLKMVFLVSENAPQGSLVITCDAVATRMTSGTENKINLEVVSGAINVNKECVHNGGFATCKTKAVCEKCGEEYGQINSNNHEHVVAINPVEATCSKTGLTAGQKCLSCSTITLAQKTISIKSHTEVNIPEKKPTYKTTGLTAGKKCKVCGKITVAQKTVKKLKLGKVSGIKVKKISVDKSSYVTLAWSKTSGAERYEIYQQTGKKWKKIKTTSSTSLTVKKLKSGSTYKFKVRAVLSGEPSGAYSNIITVKIVPGTSTLSLKAGKKQIIASWKSVSGVTGYEVVYSTSKKFTKKTTKTLTIKSKSKKTTIKKLTKGKKYYVKVRAYKTVSGKKIYGAWSSVKSVKVK